MFINSLSEMSVFSDPTFSNFDQTIQTFWMFIQNVYNICKIFLKDSYDKFMTDYGKNIQNFIQENYDIIIFLIVFTLLVSCIFMSVIVAINKMYKNKIYEKNEHIIRLSSELNKIKNQDYVKEQYKEIEKQIQDIEEQYKDIEMQKLVMQYRIADLQNKENELEYTIENKVRKNIEKDYKKELKPIIEDDLKNTLKSKVEESLIRMLKPQIEETLRNTLKPVIEQDLRNNMKKSLKTHVNLTLRSELKPVIEQDIRNILQPVIEQELRNTLKPVIEEELRNTLKPVIEEELRNSEEKPKFINKRKIEDDKINIGIAFSRPKRACAPTTFFSDKSEINKRESKTERKDRNY